MTTSAATADNPEIAAAQAQGPRAAARDLLGALMAGRTGIAIAGTHGKTTTTALLVHTCAPRAAAHLHRRRRAGQHRRQRGVGASDYFVIEADEYDNMFLGLRRNRRDPQHRARPPRYVPTRDDVVRAFAQFADRLDASGLLVACADDAGAASLAEARRAAGGPSSPTRRRAADWACDGPGCRSPARTRFTARHAGEPAGTLTLAASGGTTFECAGALAIAERLGVPIARVADAFASFLGTGRRADVMGQAGA